MSMPWLTQEEDYLSRLKNSSSKLSKHYFRQHSRLRITQGYFKMPAIVLSSVSGVASFGTSTFPRGAQRWVSIVVGGVNILISILATVEGYLKTGDLLARALAAHTSLKKLCEDIDIELSLPLTDRGTSGVLFVRDCYTRYQTILEAAPPLEDTDLRREGPPERISFDTLVV